MEQIKKLLGDELYNQVVTKLEGKKLMVDDQNFVPKARLDEVITQRNSANDQITELTNRVSALKTEAGSLEELKSAIETSKTEIASLTDKHQQELQQLKLNNAVELALRDAKAKNAKAVLANIDMGKVSLDGENLLGFSEQVEGLKKTDAYLFEDKKHLQVDDGKGVTTPPEKNPWSKDTYNLTEQAKIFKSNPELAKKLAEEAKN